MPGAWRKAMVYLGLGDEDESPEFVDEGHPYADDPSFEESAVSLAPTGAGGIVPDSSARFKPLAAHDTVPAPSAGGVPRAPQRADRLHVVEPAGFNDAKEIGDQLKRNVPVIINLADADRDLRRRLVDFTSGITYALSGKMERMSENVFLITPANVEVPAEERRRLREHGLFSSGV